MFDRLQPTQVQGRQDVNLSVVSLCGVVLCEICVVLLGHGLKSSGRSYFNWLVVLTILKHISQWEGIKGGNGKSAPKKRF